MVRPFRLALFAGATALGAATFAAGPVSAQMVMPWGLWSGPSNVYEDDDDLVVERIIPPRIVSRIVAAQGYRLASAPRLAGDTVVAIGQNARGDRVRFVIDGYSGQLLRRTALNGRETFARSDPDAPIPEALIPGAPLPRLDDEPPRKAKPKPKPHPKTAARKPTAEPKAKPVTPAPSQAIQEPTPPTPAAPAQTPEPAKAEAQQPDAPKSETPKSAAAPAAPQPADSTPLAPDAAAAQKPAATPAPQQAAVPTTPATPEKPPLTPETTSPETKPAETKGPETKTSAASPAAETPAPKPTDIGPRVVPVAPQTRAPDAADEAKPGEKATP